MSYFDKISPYLRVLIDENKAYEQKLQIDIVLNMMHISNNHGSTQFSSSDNVICMPFSNTNEILEPLLTSLYERFQDDLQLSPDTSSFVDESIEECNIHLDKIDLYRSASFIDPPDWLKHKKATMNAQNVNELYCFMYAVAIALFNKEFGNNLGGISRNLRLYSNIFNWHDITFPTTNGNYATFERLNSDVALNVLYVPFGEEKYMSRTYIKL